MENIDFNTRQRDRRIGIGLLACSIFSGFLLTACNSQSLRPTLSVCEALEIGELNPNKTIQLRGAASKVVSVSGRGKYSLSSDGCSITVIFSAESSPKSGAELIVSGNLNEQANVLGRRLVMLTETARTTQ